MILMRSPCSMLTQNAQLRPHTRHDERPAARSANELELLKSHRGHDEAKHIRLIDEVATRFSRQSFWKSHASRSLNQHARRLHNRTRVRRRELNAPLLHPEKKNDQTPQLKT